MISLYHLFVKGDVGRGCTAGGVQLGGVPLGGMRRTEDALRVFRRIVRLVFQQFFLEFSVVRLLSPENKEEPTIPKGVVGSMGL